MSREPPDLVVVDRDGVINVDSDAYVKSPAEWQALPGSLEAIGALTRAGVTVVVATNQSGVGRGLFSEAVLRQIHELMETEAARHGGRISGIYYCPHRPDEGCECRKPRPGLLQRIGRDYGCDLAGVPVIGDKVSDLAAAAAVGARGILVLTGHGRETLAALGGDGPEHYEDLAAAAAALLAERD